MGYKELAKKVADMSINDLDKLTGEDQRQLNLSWRDMEGTVIDISISVLQILANPTRREIQRWKGKTDQEIINDIVNRLKEEEKERIEAMRTVSQVDSLANQQHEKSSSRLLSWRRRRQQIDPN